MTQPSSALLHPLPTTAPTPIALETTAANSTSTKSTRGIPPTSLACGLNIPYESCIPGPLQLSGSVESLTDKKADDFTSVPIPVDTCCPKTRIQGSYTSCRSKRERHISSDDFERMAVSILKDKSPLLILLQSCPMVAPLKESLPAPIALERSSSSTTKSQSPSKSISNRSEASPEFAPITPSRTIIVRGF
ncbi:hypothetical protein AUP68_16934 [Ilyonectria robusta]